MKTNTNTSAHGNFSLSTRGVNSEVVGGWEVSHPPTKKGSICWEIASLCKAVMILESRVIYKSASAYSDLNYFILAHWRQMFLALDYGRSTPK